jgi:hypothetical protein
MGRYQSSAGQKIRGKVDGLGIVRYTATALNKSVGLTDMYARANE